MLAKYFGDLRTQRDIHKSVLYKRRQSVQSTNSKTHLTTKQHGKLCQGPLKKLTEHSLRNTPKRVLLGSFLISSLVVISKNVFLGSVPLIYSKVLDKTYHVVWWSGEFCCWCSELTFKKPSEFRHCSEFA